MKILDVQSYLGQSLMFWGKMKTQPSLELGPTDSLEKRVLSASFHKHLLRCMQNITHEECTTLLASVVSVSKLACTPSHTQRGNKELQNRIHDRDLY